MKSNNGAVFLDRDGTIIKNVHYLNDPEKVELLPKSAEGISLLNQHGFKVIIVTNQSAVARGHLSEKKLVTIHEKVLTLLKQKGARVDKIYYCPHHPKMGCECRKPRTKMFKEAVEELRINTKESYTIGDKHSDIIAGHRMHTKTALVLSAFKGTDKEDVKKLDIKPDYIGNDLLEIAEWIIKSI